MTRKTFKDNINPAMQFISSPREKEEELAPTVSKKAEGYKTNPLYVETKNRRLQLLIRPSVYEKLKRKADLDGNSINETVNIILQNALEEEQF